MFVDVNETQCKHANNDAKSHPAISSFADDLLKRQERDVKLIAKCVQ